jgi:hypothetical protein
MAARLVDDFVFFGFPPAWTSSCDRLESDDCLSLGLSSFFASDRSDRELSVFLCRLFFGLDLTSSSLWGDGGLIGMFSVWFAARAWLCGWSGGSNGDWELEEGMYGGLPS